MNFSEAQRWYDGYQFKNIKHIYNPKSIVDAMIDEELVIGIIPKLMKL